MTSNVASLLACAPNLGNVVEIGAYNVNGTARDYAKHTSWTGVDRQPGPQVDCVCEGSSLPFLSESFDALVCCETLEHCQDWYSVLSEGWRVLKVGGTCIVTVPSPGFPKHDYPSDHWRFTLRDLKGIFTDNPIVDAREWLESGSDACGVIVTKKTEMVSFVSVGRVE